jgi:hypothetical protein
MTAGELLAGRLVDPALRDQRDQVRDGGPARRAREHEYEEKSVQLEAVAGHGLPARGAGRVHGMTILSLIAVTQLGWLLVLGYGLLWLLN